MKYIYVLLFRRFKIEEIIEEFNNTVAIKSKLDNVEFCNMILLAVVLIIVLSVFIGWVKKIFTEDKEFFAQYEKFLNINRLEELLLYRILKM